MFPRVLYVAPTVCYYSFFSGRILSYPIAYIKQIHVTNLEFWSCLEIHTAFEQNSLLFSRNIPFSLCRFLHNSYLYRANKAGSLRSLYSGVTCARRSYGAQGQIMTNVYHLGNTPLDILYCTWPTLEYNARNVGGRCFSNGYHYRLLFYHCYQSSPFLLVLYLSLPTFHFRGRKNS